VIVKVGENDAPFEPTLYGVTYVPLSYYGVGHASVVEVRAGEARLLAIGLG